MFSGISQKQLARGRMGSRRPHLQGDPALHQQANLDVHEIEVLFQPLVGPDLPDHLFLEPQQLCLSQEVPLALIQEVDKPTNHAEWGVGHVDWWEGKRCQGHMPPQWFPRPACPSYATLSPHSACG